jgi:hypothetical protein
MPAAAEPEQRRPFTGLYRLPHQTRLRQFRDGARQGCDCDERCETAKAYSTQSRTTNRCAATRESNFRLIRTRRFQCELDQSVRQRDLGTHQPCGDRREIHGGTNLWLDPYPRRLVR